MSGLCKNYTIPILVEPQDLTEEETKSETKKLIWKTKVTNFVKREEIQEKTSKSYSRSFGDNAVPPCNPNYNL